MNDISTVYVSPVDASITDEMAGSLESSVDKSQTLLPRLAWNSQVAYLRAIFRAKKALDRIEKNAGILRVYN